MSQSTFTPWPLDRQGFVCHWLVAGPALSPVAGDVPAGDQFRAEAALRAAMANRERPAPPESARAGEAGPLGLPWRFEGGRDGAFVNLGAFYPELCGVRFDAATRLVAPRDMTVEAVLWSYAAADLFVNGEYVSGIDAPAYKPIRRAELRLALRAGANDVYISCRTLGARDTRSVVGLQLIDAAGVGVSLPDEACAAAVAPALALFEGAALAGDCLRLPDVAPAGARVCWRGGFEPDLALARRPVEWRDAGGLREIPLKPGEPWVTLEIPTPFGLLARRFERTEQVRPRVVTPAPSFGDNLRLILGRIADAESLNRDDGAFGFPISNLLARKALGRETARDDALFDDMLDLIERRVDCADFLVSGLVRYLKNYPVAPVRAKRVRDVLVNWRYWMDQDGLDGMCFWSENHALMFYSCALFCGEMYPEEYFPRAHKTGAALAEWGRSRVEQWLSDVEEHGFEEFLSAVYMCITFVALLNLIDFGPAGIAARAEKVADRLLEGLALHTWKGGFIAPMGRVYRGALYPFAQGAMALMNLADPSQPYDFGEGWLGFYATSRYRLPEGLKAKMDAPASASYVTGNARIVLEKREDWCLTSVQCPREPFQRWPNLTLNGADDGTHAWVKSLNERFHGTTDFQPGGYGYQQHLWYAALDGAAVVFANHPGATGEAGDMRPGYWNGNGVFPALRQAGNLLGMVYRIPREHPVHYVHLYAPRCRFDALERRGDWLLARKGRGYIGFWASAALEPWNGVSFDCEWRAYGDGVACLCVCGGRAFGDLEAFWGYCQSLAPGYADGTLAAGDYRLAWTEGRDETQYL